MHAYRKDSKEPIKVYVYSDIYQALPGLQGALGKYDLSNHFTKPHFFLINDPKHADFFLFPFSVDPLFQKLGPKACRSFLTALPHYAEHDKQHIFFMFDDQNLPLGLPSVIYRYTHDRHLQEPNSITLPALISHGDALFKKPETLAYHVSFTGALSTHFCRLQMAIPFLKPAERENFQSILLDINELQKARFDHEQYTNLTEQLKPKMHEFFPRVVQSKGLTYYFDLIFEPFRFLSEKDRQHLFTKQKKIIQNSLLVLAPRGCGSYSIRFFEILAAGRIPVLISDNYLPPLHWLINYDDFIFRIPQNQLLEIKQLMAETFKKHSLSELNDRCFKARKIWGDFLAPQKFSAFLHLTLNEVRKHDYNLNHTQQTN